MVGKKDGAGCKGDVGVPEQEVVGKQYGAGCNRAYEGYEKDVVGKQDGAVWIGSRWWPQRAYRAD